MAAYEHDPELSRYIDSVRKVPTLDRETEHDLAVRVLAGDQAAVDALVRANLRYVVAVALQYRRYGIKIADLIAEGNVGLLVAAKKFDPERGVRFVTYAGYWIRAYVLDAVVRSTSMVGGGTGPLRSKLFFRLRRERARVHNLVADPSERLRVLAERFDVTPERMQEMMRRLDARDVSLDTTVFDDSETTLVDTLVSPGESQEENLARARQRSALQEATDQALAQLDQRERYIIERRVMGDAEMSLAAIGRTLGVSRERARQLEARAKKKLRKSLDEFAPAA
jgi:RNA polymerase sigma-32 factor